MAVARILIASAIVLLAAESISAQTHQFEKAKCVWSVHMSDRVPTEPPATAEELAGPLDLVSEGEDEAGFEIWRHGPSEMEFVFVPGGWFKMGSRFADTREEWVVSSQMGYSDSTGLYEAEQPQREIWLSPFFIGLTEVTVAQYRPFVEAALRGEVESFEYPFEVFPQEHEPLLWDRPDLGFLDDDLPIAGVSWLSSYAFARWMGGRLPTEAEWEKAARGTDGRFLPWGNEFDSKRLNCDTSINHRTTPVRLYPGGRSPYGCYAMAGNVLEYTMDAYEPLAYRAFGVKDPCLLHRNGHEGLRQRRVGRGGSWTPHTGGPHRCRTTARTRELLTRHLSEQLEAGHYLWSGLRVVLSPLTDLYPPEFMEMRHTSLAVAKAARTRAAAGDKDEREDEGGH